MERPVPFKDRCSLCLQCRRICPAGAISKPENRKKGIPQYNYLESIRCYCCMEICPEAAIEKRQGRLQWMLKGMDLFR